MAADGLIEQYLSALGAHVRTRRDRGDLVDEVADHLYSASERLVSLGIDPVVAQQRALARFGEPRLVAALLTAIPSKGNTMSLFFSRHLGALSASAAVAWVAAAAASLYGQTDLLVPWTPEAYLVATLLIALACLLTTAALVGLNLRATGRPDAAGVVIGVMGVTAAIAAGLLSWFLVVWLPLLAVAVAWTFARARRAHAGSPAFATVLMVGMPLLAVATVGMLAFHISQGRTSSGALDLAIFGVLVVLLLAGLADVAVRLVRRPRLVAA